MYTYVFMTSIRVIPVSAVLSRVPYECLYLQKWVTPPLFGAAPLSSTPRARAARTYNGRVGSVGWRDDRVEHALVARWGS